jgi:tetratricopeptide (TPR) repeat protein
LAGLELELAESLNTLGLLYEHQAREAKGPEAQSKLDDAQDAYERSLELRRAIDVDAEPSRFEASRHAHEASVRATRDRSGKRGAADATDGGHANAPSAAGARTEAAWRAASTEASPNIPEGERTRKEAEKQQAIAQSLVSLGNLAIVRGDALGEGGSQQAHYSVARAHLEGAWQAYVRGFHDAHPKVAWAREGLGVVLEKQGELQAALQAYEHAAAVLRALQAQADDRVEMRQKNLEQVERRLADVQRRLAQAPPVARDALQPAGAPATAGADEVVVKVL